MVRKPLVRFETSDRAQLISASNSMPSRRRSKTHSKRRTTKGKPRIVNGRLSLKVSGFSGTQKISPSALIPYLPVTKLRAAAKRALNKTRKVGSKKSRRRRTTRRRKR